MYVLRNAGSVGLSGIVQDLSAAITRQEGANPAYNNPGNLRAGPGQTGTSANGIAIFPDFATGEAALERQVQLNINRGLTLEEFFGGKPGVYAGYAPAADSNNPNLYAANVSTWTGLPVDVPLSALNSGIVPVVDAAPWTDAWGDAWDTSEIDLAGMDWGGILPWVVGGALALVLIGRQISN